jgi:2-octaprenyl-6-methoxyphenol hydroxylase
MNSLTTDIAIIGGGLMGASTALLLAKVLPHCRIALLERHPFTPSDATQTNLPSFDARSTALAPTSVQLMERLGVWPSMTVHATAIRSIQVSDQGHVGWVRLTEADNQQQSLGAVVENHALGRALISAVHAAPSVQVLAPTTVARVVPKADIVELMLDEASGASRSLSAKLVIVADGANSLVARQLGIALEVKDYHQHAIVANVAYAKPHQGAAYERFTAQGPMALLPLGGSQSHTSALVWTWPNDQVDVAMAMSDSEFLQHLQREFGHRLGKFSAVSRRSHYPLRLSVAREQVRSRLVLLGNAAHFLHPVAGQGYNLALRDAVRLAEVLQATSPEQLGDLAVLQRYQQLQAEDQRRTITLSDGFNRVFTSERFAFNALRNLAMLTVEHSAWVRNGFIRQMSGRASPQANPWRGLANDA